MNIEYIAPIKDVSGYAAAARSYILALLDSGHNVNVIEHDFSQFMVQFTKKENQIKQHISKPNFKPDAQIFHMPADAIFYTINEPKFKNKNVPRIGLFFWEVDRVPDIWIEWLNMTDGMLLPCSRQQQIIQSQGVTVPCYTIGQAIDIDYWSPSSASPKPFNENDTYHFYSIFQWTERKNPQTLFHAYWSEFTEKDNVHLIIKSYLGDHSRAQERMILNYIHRLKSDFPNYNPCSRPGYAPHTLISHLLTTDQIKNLHEKYDCYVSPHRGEGFGLPIAEAMAMGNTVIATNYYAPEDFLTEKNSYPIGFQMRPVFAVAGYHWYTCHQNWADANIPELRRAMRDAFNNREYENTRGIMARKTIIDQYAPRVVAANIVDAVGKIIEGKPQDKS